jgi:5'(3')-deoxyribonucleotidase
VKPKLYVDCDGVLADFVSAYLEISNSSLRHDDICCWDFHVYQLHQSKDSLWRTIGQYGEEKFVRSLKPYPGAYGFVKDLAERFDVAILTTIPLRLLQARTDWVRENIGDYPVIASDRKKDFARPGIALIDDYEQNVREFRDAGGLGFLYSRPWNHVWRLPRWH